MSIRIVIADGHTLCAYPPGHAAPRGEPDWSPLASLGDVTYYPRSAPGELPVRCRDAEAVLTNKAAFDAALIGRLPKLKYIGVTATGVNVVDLVAAKQAGVTVTNAPAYGSPSVAQHVFALLLELVNHVGDHHAAVRDGRWTHSPDFAFTLGPTVELAGLTLGIVGFGQIGQAVARIAHSFDMNLIAHSRSRQEADVPVRWCELDELFESADVVTLHCPLTDQTKHLVNAARLARMKPTAYLVNTGRGPLIDEPALAAALREGRLAGAGLDVLGSEPPPEGHPLLTVPRCVITPHNAWMTQAARRRLMAIVTDNLRAFLRQSPVNVVQA